GAHAQIDHRRRQGRMLGEVEGLAELGGSVDPGSGAMQMVDELAGNVGLFLDDEDRAPTERKATHGTTPLLRRAAFSPTAGIWLRQRLVGQPRCRAVQLKRVLVKLSLKRASQFTATREPEPR